MMEANPEIELEHFIAQKLSMTVDRLRHEMSNDEFVRWTVYFGRIAQQQELARLKAGG